MKPRKSKNATNHQQSTEIPSHLVKSGLYNWAVQVDVPAGWDQFKDREYLNTAGPGIDPETSEDCRAELVEYICARFEDYHGVLTFAFAFLTGQPYEPDSIFGHFPVKTKVQLLQKLFHDRSRDKGYLDRLDDNLKKFLDVETVCIPILEKYLFAPETVWLRELVQVSDCVTAVYWDFAESMACEHEDCPNYVSVDRVDPPPKKIRSDHRKSL